MYSTDLVRGLFSLLVKGSHKHSYNIGGNKAVSIEELANCVVKVAVQLGCYPQECISELTPLVLGSVAVGVAPLQYFPRIDKLQNELKFEVKIALEEAIYRTLKWYLGNNSHSIKSIN